MAYSALGNYAFAKQSAQGSAGTAFNYFAEFSADASGPDLTSKAIYTGYARSQQAEVPTSEEYKGDATFYLTRDALSELMLLTMGGTDTVSGTVAPITHTASLGTADIPWVTFQRNFYLAGYAENVQDCKIDTLDIEAKVADVITAKFGFIGLDPRASISAPATPTFDTTVPAFFSIAPVVLKKGSTTLNGHAESWGMSFKNNLQKIPGAGVLNYVDLVPGVRSVTGKAKITWEASDDLIVAIYGLSSGAKAALTDLQAGSLTVTPAWGVNSSMAISQPNIKFQAGKYVLMNDGKAITIDLTWTAIQNAGNDEFGFVTTNSATTPF